MALKQFCYFYLMMEKHLDCYVQTLDSLLSDRSVQPEKIHVSLRFWHLISYKSDQNWFIFTCKKTVTLENYFVKHSSRNRDLKPLEH